MLMNMSRARQQGAASAALLVIMTVAFLASTVFGIWAFMGMQENQQDVDAQIAEATEAAIELTEREKEAEFAAREKEPFRAYSASPVYGSLTFGFPKSWNVFVEEKSSGTLLDFYARPELIPGTGKNVKFALRVQIVDSSYEKEAAKLESGIEKGALTAVAYRASKVPQQLGILVRGEIGNDKRGVFVLLPLRDKTFRFWTEAEEYIEDFDAIMETVTFNP